jgi:hypothetical protein
MSELIVFGERLFAKGTRTEVLRFMKDYDFLGAFRLVYYDC